MADETVYKVLRDTTLARAIRELPPKFSDGPVRYETEKRNYPVGTYVLGRNLSPPVHEQIEDGVYDDYLEEVSGDEAEAVLALGADPQYFGTYIPEHEAEAYLLNRAGHTTVPRDQVLELKAAGAEAARENLEAALETEPSAEDNPLPHFTDEVPSLVAASNDEVDAVVPVDADPVDVPGNRAASGLPGRGDPGWSRRWPRGG